MDCRQYQEALSAAALGGESESDAQAFRLHLEICEDCRGELARRREFLGAVERQMQAQFEAAPSADFNARLRRRIAETEISRLPIFNWLPVFAGATAVAVLLGLIYIRHRPIADVSPARAALSASSQGAGAEQAHAPKNPAAATHANSSREASAPGTSFLHPVMAARSAATDLKVRVDRREIYATVRFTREIAEGRIDARPLVSASQAADTTVDAGPLQIPVLEVVPLKPPSMDEVDYLRGDGGAAQN